MPLNSALPLTDKLLALTLVALTLSATTSLVLTWFAISVELALPANSEFTFFKPSCVANVVFKFLSVVFTSYPPPTQRGVVVAFKVTPLPILAACICGKLTEPMIAAAMAADRRTFFTFLHSKSSLLNSFILTLNKYV